MAQINTEMVFQVLFFCPLCKHMHVKPHTAVCMVCVSMQMHRHICKGKFISGICQVIPHKHKEYAVILDSFMFFLVCLSVCGLILYQTQNSV